MKNQPQRKPSWLKIKVPLGKKYLGVKEIVEKNKLHTICTSGHCPNMAECWEKGTATLMILGDICTRSCKFCNVKTGKPLPVDLQEPDRVAKSVKLMGIKHCVITSVDRDDLEDGGASVWAETIRKIKNTSPQTTIETLIPDFDGRMNLVQQIIDAGPEVISHNLETVEQLTPKVRSKAKYRTSLKVIKYLAQSKVRSKSGIMLGLGESREEVLETLNDLANVGCEVVTLGQYLQPTPKHLDVEEFIHPDMFKYYEEEAYKMGFKFVESGPLVRSSYHAEKHV